LHFVEDFCDWLRDKKIAESSSIDSVTCRKTDAKLCCLCANYETVSMSSLRKILSSRANGARSQGPVTPHGIQRSSQNARRHGLLAKCVVLDAECKETFESLLSQYEARFQPADDIEFGMIEEMISSYWRLRRAWAIETRLLEDLITGKRADDAIGGITAAFSAAAGPNSLALMHRYETRLHMMYQRALHNLLLLRAAGMPNEPNPVPEHSAALLGPDPDDR
jgi:hypothetical protein